MTGGVIFLMGKIGGGFWSFLAEKRAGSDSEVLATLTIQSNFSFSAAAVAASSINFRHQQLFGK